MNPFDLRGPEFLLFYAVLGTGTLGALWVLRRQRESQAPPSRLNLTDPYLIAHLRGGAHEALRVATVSLLDRGLLKADGTRLQASPDAARAVTSPLERAILGRFENGAEAAAMLDDSTLTAATGPLAETLSRHGLLPDDDALRARRSRAMLGIGLLVGVALLKVAVALSRGRSNVGFLVLLAAIFAFLVWKISFPERTPLGELALQELRSLFGGARTSGLGLSGSAAAEGAMLAAVLGLSGLPASHQAHRLYPKAAESSSNSTWDSSSSSSCSSSSGDSGGGGGCGGGGGGCGGCGS